MKLFTWLNLLRLLGGLVVLILVFIAAWVIVAGPAAVWSMMRHARSKIDDFQRSPSREMPAGPAPYPFVEDLNRTDTRLTVPIPPGAESDLDELLQANDSIALLMLKNDRLVLERYYQDHTPVSISQSFSMAKSFTSTLVGLAIADGLIESVEQPITDFIPELTARGFDVVTFHHLLTMTSGSSYVENDNPFGIHAILYHTPELEERILTFRMADAPGSVWRYKSGDNVLIGLALLRALAPQTISEYMHERLWVPLGMETAGLWSLDHTGDGLEKTWCCLAASARDFLKIGRLYLRQGDWEGQQILPAEWVQASTGVGYIPDEIWDPDFRRAGVWNYGYQWWLVSQEEGSYLALGKDGQYLYVNPATQTVILRLGWTQGKLPLSQWLALFKYLEN